MFKRAHLFTRKHSYANALTPYAVIDVENVNKLFYRILFLMNWYWTKGSKIRTRHHSLSNKQVSSWICWTDINSCDKQWFLQEGTCFWENAAGRKSIFAVRAWHRARWGWHRMIRGGGEGGGVGDGGCWRFLSLAGRSTFAKKLTPFLKT